MPQSLIWELLDQRSNGEPWSTSLNRAIFQAKSNIGYLSDAEKPWYKRVQWWKVDMRPVDDREPVDWWFAATAVPILAATLGPMANVISIGALVTSWRVDLNDPANPGQLLPANQVLMGTPIDDPRWCYWINVVSLICGFIGNLFLLLNFTGRLRYLISLPVSVSLWFLSAGLLIGDVAAVHLYATPLDNVETYSEGFWYGIAAACLYLILTILLFINIAGYVRGHYPQRFNLTEDQRTLIVQTMLFFVWLAGGAGVYSRLEGWLFVDALYYCDVTILTIGFGDLYPTEDGGRALLIPFSAGGIIMLGLVIASIYKSVQDIGDKNIIQQHFEQERERTIGRTVTSSVELERREIEIEIAKEREQARRKARGSARSPATAQQASIAQTLAWSLPTESRSMLSRKTSFSSLTTQGAATMGPVLSRTNTMKSFDRKRKTIVMLREEKERFEAMRKIQYRTDMWRNWWRLGISLGMFCLFWLLGAFIFYECEYYTLQLTYWQSVYFCWVAILSIGYGDYAPKSGAGRCFFVIWSLIAVPTVTILAGDLTNTVVAVFNHASNSIADYGISPGKVMFTKSKDKESLLTRLRTWWQRRTQERAAKDRVQKGFQVGYDMPDKEKGESTDSNGSTIVAADPELKTREDAVAAGNIQPDLPDLAAQRDADVAGVAAGKIPDAAVLARQLALAIRRTARDLALVKGKEKQYTYEDWVEFTRLIRFSAAGGATEAVREGEEEGLVEWDWIGEDSPMMAQLSEPEFVLERLVESLVRYLRRNPPVERFAAGLREKGEEALRFKSKVPDEEPMTPTAANASNSYAPGFLRPVNLVRTSSAPNVRSPEVPVLQPTTAAVLHALDEHEEEHADMLASEDESLEIKRAPKKAAGGEKKAKDLEMRSSRRMGK